MPHNIQKLFIQTAQKICKIFNFFLKSVHILKTNRLFQDFSDFYFCENCRDALKQADELRKNIRSVGSKVAKKLRKKELQNRIQSPVTTNNDTLPVDFAATWAGFEGNANQQNDDRFDQPEVDCIDDVMSTFSNDQLSDTHTSVHTRDQAIVCLSHVANFLKILPDNDGRNLRRSSSAAHFGGGRGRNGDSAEDRGRSRSPHTRV